LALIVFLSTFALQGYASADLDVDNRVVAPVHVGDGIAARSAGVTTPEMSEASFVTSLDIPVVAGTDDAEERPNGDVALGQRALNLVVENGLEQTVGLRFTEVRVPSQATVTRAYVQFQTRVATSTATNLTVRGESVDDARPFTSAVWDVSSRARTSASVQWSPPAWTMIGEAGPNQRTSDLSPVLQEIFDRPGWVSGNAVTLIISGSGRRVAEAWEGARAPVLHLEFAGDETASQCSDGVDNDSDGEADHPADLGCAGPADDDEGDAPPLGPTTYYISPDGSDQATGTSPQSPWRSLERANLVTYGPGDRLLLQGGASFSGPLYFEPGESGTPQAPIMVDSYGTGRATINVRGSNGLLAHNAGGISVEDLEFRGPGRVDNPKDGVFFYNDLPGDVTLPYVRVDNVEASGFDSGVVVGAFNGGSGYRDVRLTRLALHENVRAGLMVYGPPFNAAAPDYVHEDVYVGEVTAYNNSGDPNDLVRNSGSGIVLGGVKRGTIERSLAYNNGFLCAAKEGPVGIWAYDSTDVTIQFNESHHNRTGGPADGGGFDLDQNTSNSRVQYNYSHDNDGPGFLAFTGQSNQAHRANTIRFNISQNDGRKNRQAGIVLGGRLYDAHAYHNSIYMAAGRSGSPAAVRVVSTGGSGVKIRNNILYTDGGVPLVVAPAVSVSKLQYQGNAYFPGGESFVIRWGSRTYGSLATWRTATGQEVHASNPTGLSVDPQWLSPGGGGTFDDPSSLAALSAYKLRDSSPLIDKGLTLSGVFGNDIGPHDYYGTPVPAGAGPEVGTYEKS
jgi:hypothetical protein